MLIRKIKGRGAQINPQNRFERIHIEELYDDSSFSEDGEINKVKTIFYNDDSRSVISKNDSLDLYFNYSFNPYRGCEHGCIYCYARPTHEFLGFSSGLDFETKIMIKKNAAGLLEKELRKKNYIPEVILFSGNTDCYQPVEKSLMITRKALKVCLDYKNPVSIITKNYLVLRDLDIIKEMSRLNLVTVMITITSLNRELVHKMEPRSSSPEKRLNTIKTLAENNIPVGVNIAPVIPGLTDDEIPNILKESANSGALFASYALLRLPYSVKDLFIDWLLREFPDSSNKVLNRIKETRGGKLNENEFGKRFTGEGILANTISNLFQLSCKKYGLNEERIKLSIEKFQSAGNRQLEIF